MILITVVTYPVVAHFKDEIRILAPSSAILTEMFVCTFFRINAVHDHLPMSAFQRGTISAGGTALLHDLKSVNF